jgi:hypothetical protein
MDRVSAVTIRQALVIVLGFTLLFCWLFARLLFTDAYLAESDLYDWFLPLFLSPPALWSSTIFAGLPSFADTSDAAQYPIQFFFSHILRSWNGYAIAGYVLAASFTYAYVWRLTSSRAAGWIAGLAFSLSESMIERQAHINFVHAFAWLPLILLSIERVLGDGSLRWVSIGSVALACCFLSGHPQPLLYVGLVSLAYAVTGLVAGRSWRFAAGPLVLMFVLSGALASIKALPFLEVARHISRTTVSYGQFIAQSHTPAGMLGVLFPSIEHNGREAPLYVGLAVLTLAVIGSASNWQNWRVKFWLVIGLIALLVGAGDSTPFAAWLHHLAIFNKFRVASRMLFLFAFGAAALAGLGTAALASRSLKPAVAHRSVAALAIAMAGGATILLFAKGVSFEPRWMPFALPWWNNGVWMQLLIALLTSSVIAWSAHTRSVRWSIAVLTIVLVGDVLYSLPYAASWNGLAPIAVRRSSLEPSLHTRALAQQIVPRHQRLLSLTGTTRDPLVPAGFARLWNVPIAGGYSPIVLANLARLAEMGGNGDVRPVLLAPEDRALDVLAVRYLTVRDDDFPTQPVFERSGIRWNATPLGLTIGRADCGHMYERQRVLALPAEATITGVALVAHMRCAEDVAQGATVAAINIVSPEGVTLRRQPLLAGIHLGERNLVDPAVSQRAGHKAPPAFDDPSEAPNLHLIRIDLDKPIRGGRIVLEGAATRGWTTIERLTLIDDRGRFIPQDVGPLLLGDRERWRFVRHVRTSRHTDRSSDEEAPDELGVTVYENMHGLPRAWIVDEVIRQSDSDAIQAVRRSQLADGRTFDPARQALVEGDVGPQRFSPGRHSATVTSIADGRISLDVTTEGDAFLVLSEMFYPGWRARIDGRNVAVHRTDVALQGLFIPAGRHVVEFELASTTLRAGTMLSLLGLGAAMLLIRRSPSKPGLHAAHS